MAHHCESGRYVLTVETTEPIIEPVHTFLRTSQWGNWSLESGDDLVRSYRRGCWTKSWFSEKLVPSDKADGDTYDGWVESAPSPDTPCEYPIAMLLSVAVQPLRERSIATLDYQGYLAEPKGLDAWARESLQYIVDKDIYKECSPKHGWYKAWEFVHGRMRAETASLAGYLKEKLALSAEPTIS